MRIWYVVDTVEYWIEPGYRVGKTGKITIEGAKLYDRSNVYKGYWNYKDWPTAVRTTVRQAISAHERREQRNERLERVRVRSHLGKTK